MKIEELSSDEECSSPRRSKNSSSTRNKARRGNPKYDFSFLQRPDPATIKISCARNKLKQIKKFSKTMDDLPFNPLPIPIGLDSLIGLIPLVGDPVSLLLALYQIWLAFSGLGVPYSLVGKMLIIVIFDFFVGLIPIVGDLLDTAIKANILNHKLAEDWFENNIYLYQDG